MGGRAISVVHYINQLFAGIGGEDKADEPVSLRPGPVGPGLRLQQHFGDHARVVATVIAGDNYFNSQLHAARSAVDEFLRARQPDVVVAGPAFNAGRYGMACCEVCQAAADLGIPSVTAMFPDNPGLLRQRRDFYVLPTGERALSMPESLERLASFALRLALPTEGQARREEIGPAIQEGYLPRGYRKDVMLPESAAERAISTLKARLAGRPFQTELPVEEFDRVAPAPPVVDLAHTRVALVTSGGVVPKGNPDRLREYQAVAWARYSVAELNDLTGDQFEPIHGGYDSTWARQEPDRVVPLDALRALESEGVIGDVHSYYYVTTGVGTTVANSKKFGREIARELREAGVGAVVLTST